MEKPSRREKAAKADALPDPSAGPAVVLPALERALLKLAKAVMDIGYSHNNPEKILEQKSEVSAKLEQLASLYGGRSSKPA